MSVQKYFHFRPRGQMFGPYCQSDNQINKALMVEVEVSLEKLPSDECHWTLRMMSMLVQVMVWCWLCRRQQIITWTNVVYPDLWHHWATMSWYIEVHEKRLPLYRWQFHIHFLVWKSVHFDCNFTVIYSQGPMSNKPGLVFMLALHKTGNKWLSFNDDLVYWRIYASLSVDELTHWPLGYLKIGMNNFQANSSDW